MSFLARTRVVVGMASPYRTAGTKPWARSRREAFDPRPWRFSLLTRMVFMMFSLREQGADRAPFVDPPDRLAEQLGDGENGEAAGRGGLLRQRDRVGHEDPFEFRAGDPVQGGPGQDGMGAGAEDPLGAFLLQGLGAQGQGAGRVDHVVVDDDVPAGDVADDVQDF